MSEIKTHYGKRTRKCGYCRNTIINDELHLTVVQGGGYHSSSLHICSICIEKIYLQTKEGLFKLKKRLILEQLKPEGGKK